MTRAPAATSTARPTPPQRSMRRIDCRMSRKRLRSSTRKYAASWQTCIQSAANCQRPTRTEQRTRNSRAHAGQPTRRALPTAHPRAARAITAMSRSCPSARSVSLAGTVVLERLLGAPPFEARAARVRAPVTWNRGSRRFFQRRDATPARCVRSAASGPYVAGQASIGRGSCHSFPDVSASPLTVSSTRASARPIPSLPAYGSAPGRRKPTTREPADFRPEQPRLAFHGPRKSVPGARVIPSQMAECESAQLSASIRSRRASTVSA